jgi:hypothetical protein
MSTRPKPKAKPTAKAKPQPANKTKAPAAKVIAPKTAPAPLKKQVVSKVPVKVEAKAIKPEIKTGKPDVKAGKPVPAPGTPVREGKAAGAARKSSSRRSPLANRRGPDGELFTPGDLVIPGGAQTGDEALYFFRGCAAAEKPGALEAGLNELIAKRKAEEDAALKNDIHKLALAMARRFETGPIEQVLPNRPQPPRRTFQGVTERAKARRREIGAFLRGLDLGRTETSHMDSHGEASLQSLMEWAARLEILTEADEPQQADYGQFHRVLDQLDSNTEALVVDVEQTLRRLRDRLTARRGAAATP